MQFDESHRDVLNEILRWRRDVRHFKSDPVTADVLNRLACNPIQDCSSPMDWPWQRIALAAARTMVRSMPTWNGAPAATSGSN